MPPGVNSIQCPWPETDEDLDPVPDTAQQLPTAPGQMKRKISLYLSNKTYLQYSEKKLRNNAISDAIYSLKLVHMASENYNQAHKLIIKGSKWKACHIFSLSFIIVSQFNLIKMNIRKVFWNYKHSLFCSVFLLPTWQQQQISQHALGAADCWEQPQNLPLKTSAPLITAAHHCTALEYKPKRHTSRTGSRYVAVTLSWFWAALVHLDETSK